MRRTRFGTAAVALVTAACGSGSDRTAEPGASGSTSAQQADGIHGSAPPATRGIPSIVMLSPAGNEPGNTPPRAGDSTVDQLGMVFSPKVLVAWDRADIRFTNSESIAHNVTLRSLDTGTIVFESETDPSGSVTFSPRASGAYDLTCSIHPGMTGFIYVSAAPYAVAADADGSYTLTDVPPGSYALEIWNVDADVRSVQAVTITETTMTVSPAG